MLRRAKGSSTKAMPLISTSTKADSASTRYSMPQGGCQLPMA